MKKKELEKYVETLDFLHNPVPSGNGLLNAKLESFDGKDTLVVSMLHRVLKCVLFLQKDDDITAEIREKGEIKWLTGSIDSIFSRNGHWGVTMDCDSPDSRKAVEDFTGRKAEQNIRWTIDSFQESIRGKKRAGKEAKRKEQTAMEMEGIGELPAGTLEFAKDLLTPHILYNGKEKGKKEGFCTRCETHVKLEGKYKAGESYDCPNCKTTARLETFNKLLSYNWYTEVSSSSQNYDARETFTVLDRNKAGEIVVRVVKSYFVHCAGVFGIYNEENMRYILDGTNAPRPYYFNGTWIRGQKAASGYGWYRDYYFCEPNGYLFADNVKEVLKDTPYQNCQLEERALKDKNLDVANYLYKFQVKKQSALEMEGVDELPAGAEDFAKDNFRTFVFDKNKKGELVVRILEKVTQINEAERFIFDGKKVPRGYVFNEDGWLTEKFDVRSYIEGAVYQDNLDEVLQDTPFKYCCLKTMLKTIPLLKVLNYLYMYQKFPKLELMVKAGMTNLAKDMIDAVGNVKSINTKADKPYEMLGLTKEGMKFAISTNMTLQELSYAQSLTKADGYINPIAFRFLKEQKLSLTSKKELDFALERMSGAKFARYFKAQLSGDHYGTVYYGNKLGRMLIDYRDYLTMREKIAGQIRSSFMLFPDNLKASHDAVNRLCKTENLDQFNGALEAMAKKLEKEYGFEQDDFCIVVPNGVTSIAQEAINNRNCVDKYIEAMAQGQTTILFLRHKETPDKSLITIEITDGIIKQARSFDNGDLTPEMANIISLFAEKKNLSMDGMNYRRPA